MKKRLGNFLLLGGLLCLALFFTSSTFLLDKGLLFFGGISLISLGLLFKRSARAKKGQDKGRRQARVIPPGDGRYD